MENNLKKEFNKRDVQRMRNLITGKVSDATQTQIGWENVKKEYGEGDIWEENGKAWTIKNGLKQTVTKYDEIKKLVYFPLACPTCNAPMKPTVHNKKMYIVHKECFDCVIKKETQLKVEGKYNEYEKNILNGNKNSLLQDLEQALDSWLTDTDSYISEDGVVEEWKGGKRSETEYNQYKEAIKVARDQEI